MSTEDTCLIWRGAYKFGYLMIGTSGNPPQHIVFVYEDDNDEVVGGFALPSSSTVDSIVNTVMTEVDSQLEFLSIKQLERSKENGKAIH